jgi:Trp operon repressor
MRLALKADHKSPQLTVSNSKSKGNSGSLLQEPHELSLIDVLQNLKTREEYEAFIQVILTNKELEVINNRLRILQLTFTGLTQREIVTASKTSNVTVARCVRSMRAAPSIFVDLIKRLGRADES